MVPASIHAATRFGLGAKPNELHAIGDDPRAWLDQQLSGKFPLPAPLAAAGNGYMGKPVADLRNKPGSAPNKKRGEDFIEETGARIAYHASTSQPFFERLVLFWSNHFTVSTQKGFLRPIINHYEVHAIRPHVNGYFKDMLLAVSRHPAMLLYLDNVNSIGANSKAGTRRNKGLNENLAREILELHTLGVNGGYGQADVIALANIITGWSLKGNGREQLLGYQFRPQYHSPGGKTLLGKTYAEEGENEGVRALTALAAHPATAQHIATKLVRHFIADEPPPAAVEAVANAFTQSNGHLPTTMRALIARPEAWANPRSKFKTPYEYIVSVFRAASANLPPRQNMAQMAALNFQPFNAPSPAGFDDIAASWLSPDAIIKRIEWSQKFAQRLRGGTDPMAMAQASVGELSASTSQQIARAASGADGLGLLFASPEFQRR